MKTYEALAGESIKETTIAMVKLATKCQDEVRADFNGITILATPNTDPKEIVDWWTKESKRRLKAYVNSDKYKQQQKETKEKQVKQNMALYGALAASPKHITLSDYKAWIKCISSNTDPYGEATVEYAERWARLMEGRVASRSNLTAREALESCASDCSHLADNEGITGFMYGCAVSILAQTWIHGEDLRRWHNCDCQLHNEGDRANESGEILNPAIVSISK